MKYIFLTSFIFLLVCCSKPKTVLICGDHVCINKSEAKQYFEENLTIEVKVINPKEKKEINLVELNLNESSNDKRQISILEKKKSKNDLKILSKEEITKIKKDIKKKNKKSISNKKDTNKQKQREIKNISKKIKDEQKEFFDRNVNKKAINVVDVCTILEKCSIDEISDYLIEQGKKKKYPNLSKR